jgi:hypothetical protein
MLLKCIKGHELFPCPSFHNNKYTIFLQNNILSLKFTDSTIIDNKTSIYFHVNGLPYPLINQIITNKNTALLNLKNDLVDASIISRLVLMGAMFEMILEEKEKINYETYLDNNKKSF